MAIILDKMTRAQSDEQVRRHITEWRRLAQVAADAGNPHQEKQYLSLADDMEKRLDK